MKRAISEIRLRYPSVKRAFISDTKIINPEPNNFKSNDTNSMNRYLQDFMKQMTQKVDEKVEKMDEKYEKIAVETALQKERLNQLNSDMVRTVQKEVTYVVQNQDLVTNVILDKAMTQLEGRISQRFIEQEKLFDAKLEAIGAKLINEFHKSKKEAQRWGAALGLAGATLGLGFFQYNDFLKHKQKEEGYTDSDQAQHVAKKS